jgi:hypothetical protein
VAIAWRCCFGKQLRKYEPSDRPGTNDPRTILHYTVRLPKKRDFILYASRHYYTPHCPDPTPPFLFPNSPSLSIAFVPLSLSYAFVPLLPALLQLRFQPAFPLPLGFRLGFLLPASHSGHGHPSFTERSPRRRCRRSSCGCREPAFPFAAACLIQGRGAAPARRGSSSHVADELGGGQDVRMRFLFSSVALFFSC